MDVDCDFGLPRLRELPSSDARDFFEEAKVSEQHLQQLRYCFDKFVGPDGTLGLPQFRRLLEYYQLTSTDMSDHWFHVFDRAGHGKLDFDAFKLGCCAADPGTVHILNSFTGYTRAMFIFRFYDRDGDQHLNFDEMLALVSDIARRKRAQTMDNQGLRSLVQKLGVQTDSCMSAPQFFELVRSEQLRGTSWLFRFDQTAYGSVSVLLISGEPRCSTLPHATVKKLLNMLKKAGETGDLDITFQHRKLQKSERLNDAGVKPGDCVYLVRSASTSGGA